MPEPEDNYYGYPGFSYDKVDNEPEPRADNIFYYQHWSLQRYLLTRDKLLVESGCHDSQKLGHRV